jgi:hypothetical protein
MSPGQSAYSSSYKNFDLYRRAVQGSICLCVCVCVCVCLSVLQDAQPASPGAQNTLAGANVHRRWLACKNQNAVGNRAERRLVLQIDAPQRRAKALRHRFTVFGSDSLQSKLISWTRMRA